MISQSEQQDVVALETIFEYYSDITRENVIKLLLRCRMLYNARVDVIKILFIIIKNEASSIRIKKLRDKAERGEVLTEEEKKLIMDKRRNVSRLESQLSQFKHEHMIYRGHFIFKE